ncbi:MAG: hypothetical protein LAO22_20060 [Acidobacteriia bacterium]|nr:hypothetical protein [Terriglobia bacterium]
MNPFTLVRTALFVLLMAAIAVCADKTQSAYQEGTITKNFSAAQKSYELKGTGEEYQINNCGDFQTGQAVDFRVKDNNVYIRREDGKEYKCGIKARSVASAAKGPPAYEKGTITGWSTRLDTNSSGGGNGTVLHLSAKRRTRIYELKGVGMVYQIDDCGSFQAGQFTPGQVVDYRVDEADKNDKRIYIRHEGDKEYKCRMEGARNVEGDKTDVPSTAPSTQH